MLSPSPSYHHHAELKKTQDWETEEQDHIVLYTVFNFSHEQAKEG